MKEAVLVFESWVPRKWFECKSCHTPSRRSARTIRWWTGKQVVWLWWREGSVVPTLVIAEAIEKRSLQWLTASSSEHAKSSSSSARQVDSINSQISFLLLYNTLLVIFANVLQNQLRLLYTFHRKLLISVLKILLYGHIEQWTAASLAQLVGHQSAVREIEGSNPRLDQHSGVLK